VGDRNRMTSRGTGSSRERTQDKRQGKGTEKWGDTKVKEKGARGRKVTDVLPYG